MTQLINHIFHVLCVWFGARRPLKVSKGSEVLALERSQFPPRIDGGGHSGDLLRPAETEEAKGRRSNFTDRGGAVGHSKDRGLLNSLSTFVQRMDAGEAHCADSFLKLLKSWQRYSFVIQTLAISTESCPCLGHVLRILIPGPSSTMEM